MAGNDVKGSLLPSDGSPTTDDYMVTVDGAGAGTKKITLAQLITLIKANIFPLTADVLYNPYKFHVRKSNAQSPVGSAFSVVQFNAEDFDTNNNFDSTTNYRYTAPIDGFYWFKGQVTDDTGATTIFIPSLFKNGVEYSRGNDIRTSLTNRAVHVSDLMQLTAGDTVDLRVFPDATTGLDVSAVHLCTFAGYLVSKT